MCLSKPIATVSLPFPAKFAQDRVKLSKSPFFGYSLNDNSQLKLLYWLGFLMESERDAPVLMAVTIKVEETCCYEAAAISNASSHSGRRTFITALSEKGVSVRVIQALARHSSLATTQRYIDVSADKLRTAVEGLTI